MGARAERLKAALAAFDARGEFTEDDLGVLRATLQGAVRLGADSGRVLDGLVGLFFERHLLDDRRRRELLALDGDALEAAVRPRFRQVVSDDHDAQKPYHALKAHVRDALSTLGADTSGSAEFPVSIQAHGAWAPAAVEQAVAALWKEARVKPTAHEATVDLLARYQAAPTGDSQITRDFPEVVRARLDAQRLARGILEVLSAEEKDLLRFILDAEGSVEEWGAKAGVSRASAYRLMSRLKGLCRIEVEERSSHTKIEILSALRDNLKG